MTVPVMPPSVCCESETETHSFARTNQEFLFRNGTNRKCAKVSTPATISERLIVVSITCDLEEFSPGMNALGNFRSNGEHRFVDDLSESQMQCDTAEKVGVGFREAPARSEEINHARSRGARGADRVFGRFDDDPRVVRNIVQA